MAEKLGIITPLSFGPYLLLERIAVGGMAELYLAQTKAVGGFIKLLVIKKIRPHVSSNPDFVSMFIEEAKLTVQLTHANIVQVYDFGAIEGTYFLALEFVEGKNLREIFLEAKKQKKELRIGHIAYLFSEITRGLDYAHRKVDRSTHQELGIVHRDISPQNIICSYEGEVKILDFGIAKIKTKVEETKEGVLKGKFSYMSPEQAEGKTLDARTDIFSSGIILYELLTGMRLFKRDSDTETLEIIKQGEFFPPSHYRPEIPDFLDKITLRSLARDKEKRYQTALSMHQDITKFLYLYEPEFTTLSLAKYLRDLFAEDILDSRKRLQKIYQAGIALTGEIPPLTRPLKEEVTLPGAPPTAWEKEQTLTVPPIPEVPPGEEETEPGIIHPSKRPIPKISRKGLRLALFAGAILLAIILLQYLLCPRIH